MKICVISDIHGSTLWETIVDSEYDNVDRFIFLGDYLDDKEELITPTEQHENLQRIVEFKEEFQSVDLLIGNHDLQYVGGCRCGSAFKQSTYNLTNGYLIELIRNRTIQVVAIYENYLFSHAGVSAIWMKEKGISDLSRINQEFALSPLFIDFVSKAETDISGENEYQSPIWIRLYSFLPYGYKDYTQVVGHTRLEEGKIVMLVEDNKRLFLTDTGLKQYMVVDTVTKTEEIKDIRYERFRND